MAHDFQGRVIWITGAAGALGRASAEALAAQGAVVIASGRRPEALPVGEGIVPLPLDVTSTPAAEAAATEIVAKFGRLDGLVTSTNLPIFGDFLSLDDDAWRQVIDAKLLGTVRLVRAALPHLIAAGKGSVVVLSGRGGIEPSPQHLPGSSVNAALILLVRGLGAIYGPNGIRINAVSPGPIKSPRLDALNAAGTGTPVKTPLEGPGLPADVANAVAFLLSDEAGYITGTNLFVDGGGRALS